MVDLIPAVAILYDPRSQEKRALDLTDPCIMPRGIAQGLLQEVCAGSREVSTARWEDEGAGEGGPT